MHLKSLSEILSEHTLKISETHTHMHTSLDWLTTAQNSGLPDGKICMAKGEMEKDTTKMTNFSVTLC